MASSEGLKDVGKPLDVTEKDVIDVRKAATRERLVYIVKLGLPIPAFVLGLLVGRMADAQSTYYDTYPFLGAAGIQTVPRAHRRLTWTATIVLSVVLYIFGMLLAMGQGFGVSIMYGPHSRQPNIP